MNGLMGPAYHDHKLELPPDTAKLLAQQGFARIEAEKKARADRKAHHERSKANREREKLNREREKASRSLDKPAEPAIKQRLNAKRWLRVRAETEPIRRRSSQTERERGRTQDDGWWGIEPRPYVPDNRSENLSSKRSSNIRYDYWNDGLPGWREVDDPYTREWDPNDKYLVETAEGSENGSELVVGKVSERGSRKGSAVEEVDETVFDPSDAVFDLSDAFDPNDGRYEPTTLSKSDVGNGSQTSDGKFDSSRVIVRMVFHRHGHAFENPQVEITLSCGSTVSAKIEITALLIYVIGLSHRGMREKKARKLIEVLKHGLWAEDGEG